MSPAVQLKACDTTLAALSSKRSRTSIAIAGGAATSAAGGDRSVTCSWSAEGKTVVLLGVTSPPLLVLLESSPTLVLAFI